MTDPAREPSTRKHAEERARPAASWRLVLIAFFVTFLLMVTSIYWVIRTGKL